MEFKQFDRFVESLREQQYAPLQLLLTTREQYKHLGELWLRRMWSDPPLRTAATHARVTSATSVAAAKSGELATPLTPSTPRGPDEPPSRHALGELFGQADDGRICQTLEGVSLSEDGAEKILCGGDLVFSTKVEFNPNTGAPTDWIYTIKNNSLRDVDVTLDFDQSKGVGAVTLELKQEADSVIHAVVKAKEAHVVAWLRPRKKKSTFAWENNSDDEDDMDGRRKKKKNTIIIADVKITKLWSSEVSCQVLSDMCSAVFNVRTSKIFDPYFSGRPCENVFEWLQFHDDAARTDNIAPVLELGRLLAFLQGAARDYSMQVLESFEALGEVRNKVLLKNLKSALLQTFGPHNVALMMACAAGTNAQVKELLLGDDLTQAASRRISYATKETYGPRRESAKTNVFGRDPRAPEGWLHTLPYVLRLPVHGTSWTSHLTGETALHLACAYGNFHVASTLVQRGWKCDQCDNFGHMPGEVATLRGHRGVAVLMHTKLWSSPRWTRLPTSVDILNVASKSSSSDSSGSGAQVEEDNDAQLPMHVITAVNTLRELRRGSVLAAEEVTLIEHVWSGLQELDPEAIEWKTLESQRNMALSANTQAVALSAAATALEESVNGPEKDSDEDEAETGSEQSESEAKHRDGGRAVAGKENENKTEENGAILVINDDGVAQQQGATNIKDATAEASDVDADNFDMLNLWHVCLAGNSHCISAALLYGHKLRYYVCEGWRSVPCTPKINYKRRGTTWTDRGGKNVIHALALQKYPIPGSQMKPCLLSFLNSGWPAYRPDMKGITPTDYAKRLGHKALHGVMLALIRTPPPPPPAGSSEDDEDEDEDETDSDDDASDGAHRGDNKTAKKKKEPPCRDWAYTKSASNGQHRALAALCTGAQGESCPLLVREAVFGGKYIFTAGSCERPVLQCRKRDNEQFPVRYDPEWTCRFEPTVSEDLPGIDGLGFTALHIAALSGQCEISGMLLSAGWDPLARTARGQTPVDLARLMGWEALHHALEEVSEGGTSDFFGSLLAYVQLRCIDYTDRTMDIVDKAKQTWEHIDRMYTEEKQRKLEEERRAQSNGGEKKRRKKKKSPKKKKTKKTPPRQKQDGGSGLMVDAGPNADAKHHTDMESALEGSTVPVKKTFFRGRLNFRSRPIMPSVNLATWTCNCTTINTASAASCKFCHREKGYRVWVCDCTSINEISSSERCKSCHLQRRQNEASN
jgi:hypothetical protein